MSRKHHTSAIKPEPVEIGGRYGRLTILAEVEAPLSGRREVHCRCDCGEVITRQLKDLKSGNTSSCGCLRRDLVAAKNSKHGMRKRGGESPPEYFVWKQMRNRCNSPAYQADTRYGGRGITVDPRWDEFAQFLADMGSRPGPKHSIERVDNDGNYGPGNCRWATASEQARNKRKTVKVVLDGEEHKLIDLAEAYGIRYGLLVSRLRHGWTPERALSEPVATRKNEYGSR